jgi:hypothetical protein
MITKHEDGSVSGTLYELLNDLDHQFQQLSPEEQETARKTLYEKLTGQPSSTMPEVKGEKGMTPEEAKQRFKEAIEAEREHPPLTARRPMPKKE